MKLYFFLWPTLLTGAAGESRESTLISRGVKAGERPLFSVICTREYYIYFIIMAIYSRSKRSGSGNGNDYGAATTTQIASIYTPD